MEEWVRNEVGMAKEIRTEVYKERPLLFKGEGWNSDPSSLLLGRDSMAKATPRRKRLIGGLLALSEGLVYYHHGREHASRLVQEQELRAAAQFAREKE